MKYLLRGSALLLLALSFTACPQHDEPQMTSFVRLPVTESEPDPTPTPYEDPADCECVRDELTGRIVCTSACSRPK